jgi:hypothetical protein
MGSPQKPTSISCFLSAAWTCSRDSNNCNSKGVSATIVNRRNAQTQSLPPARSPAASQALGKRWQLLASAYIRD